MNKQNLLALEIQVWDAFKTGDSEKDTQLLAHNFLGVYETGCMDRAQHAAQLESGPLVDQYQLTDEKMLKLSDEVFLLTYRAVWSPVKDGNVCEPESMYVSSVWQMIDSEWKNIFSQDTTTKI